ncbi:sialidase-like isoform X2 [Archocentrus centrarchus]|uniref:sialidase-like isoform X2 n=1 Tax=Archocentrus centrarchus TaxID=63155 RepID=UPI0011EA4478|nr:sialidase-like isoform X2 [Archocentrus centrarchus]
MDNPTANKSQLPCPSWMTQNGWSAASSQGPLINPLSTSYDHMQAPNQSCTSNLSSLSSRNNPHAAMYKGSPIVSMPSSSSLFATDIPNLSQAISFGQQNHHPSSIMVTATQGKNVTSSSLRQSNQGLQPCRPQHLSVLSPHDPFKAFQNPISSQGLSGIQDLRPSLPSCRQHQAAFEGENMESAHVRGNTQSYVSSASQEQPQWVPPSQCRGAVNDSVHANKDANKSTLASHEKRRSDVLQQRAQLLKQLAEMDKLLEALPPDNSSDGQPSVDDPAHCDQTAERSKSHRSADSSPSYDDEQNDACDTPEDPASPAESAKKDTASDTSGEDDDRDYLPGSDAESKEASSDESSHSNPASPASEEPASEEQKSGSSSAKSVTPVNKTPMISQAAASQTPVLPATRRTNSKYRVYDKRNYCLFCSKCVLKLSRHLELLHSDRPEVAAAFQYPKHSKERQNIWKKLRNQGNFEHNKKVLKTGEGALVVRQRPKVAGRAKDFLPCLHCHGLL